MDFGSQNFLFFFLPIIYFVYCAIGIKMRSIVLLLASLYFYASGDSRSILIFLDVLILNYLFGLLLDRCDDPAKRARGVAIVIAANLAILFIFKYLGFFCGTLNSALQSISLRPVGIQQFPIPLGLSFITFQAIAYLVDIYREDIRAERNFFKFSLAFAMFSKITAGPIVRMHQIEEQIAQPVVTLDDFVGGAKRIIIGLGKKLIIADTIAKVADQIFSIPSFELTTPVAWLGIICYTLQLYFDFSGYTDMAIGIGRLFGYRLPENFDYPYTAKSLTEFWRRWHLSLSTWFRDYLYIPLSYALMTDKIRQKISEGTYKTNYRALLSIVVVFTLCGLWHGSNWNFVIWGMLHGIILALESWKLGKIMKKWWAPFSHLYLLSVIMISWVFFRIPELGRALYFIKALTGFGHAGFTSDQLRSYVTIELLLVLGIATIASIPIAKGAKHLLKIIISRFFSEESTQLQFIGMAEAFMLAAVFVASMQSVMGTASKPFIYAQF
ncbi:putative alginate O-acetylase AlgI [Geobacter sp. OR-1]|uniref:MBOAT family O-acyltransferase n=1 Tax=Geobacter sp. OR-1 TaxID=1266765 RepID=UPI000542A861|nr:MBOAT family O-acyltransferase [Geobacter sp. OR-1]GAM10580.1 putative alginate O-acetylase AlgI [Geobacter sp. OR-1]